MAATPTSKLDPVALNKMIVALASIVLVFYGIYVTLSAICIHYLLTKKRRNTIVLAYTIISLLVSTVYMVTTAKYTETFLIEDINNTKPLLTKLVILEQVAYTSKTWLADSLLIYRLWIIWDGAWLFIMPPIGLMCASFGIGLAEIVFLAQNAPLNKFIELGIGVNTCSITLNILATSLISGKLLAKRKWAISLSLDHAKVYLSMTTIFAESGALYSVIGLVYIPVIAVNSPLKFVFSPIMDAAAGIAPMLILLRVALGVAISKETLTSLADGIQTHRGSTKVSAVQFAPGIEFDTGSSGTPDSSSISGVENGDRPKEET